MGKEEIRKGPWSENEDVKLVMYVKLFGDRRWDFIAQVSGLKLGLKRSGKSCRLRWINYLHPGLRGGKMTPQEQLLVLQLHSKWGNRWSRIASHLPGRTDNEIKNYWRTYTRKKAQKERKHAIYNKLSPNLWQTSSTSTSRSTQSISCSCHVVAPTLKARPIQTETTGESMENNLNTSSSSNKLMTMAMGSSPSSMWDSLWNMDWEEINKLAFTTQQYPSTNHN